MQFRADVEDLGARRTVRLAGRLEGSQAAEVTRLCEERPGAVRLDLADLVSADDQGLAILEVLRGRDVALVGTSPYLALQLEIARAARPRKQVKTTSERR